MATNAKIPTQETSSYEASFEKWLQYSADKPYKEKTIKSYIYALNKAGEWLEINLVTPIMSIRSIDEFTQVEQSLRAVPDYEDINYNRGHGCLSAALGAYRKFLSSISSEHEIGIFSSWEIIDEVTATKICDKSVFENYGSNISRQIYWFFDAHTMNRGDSKNITITFLGTDYPARITVKAEKLGRAYIFWNSDFAQKLNSLRTNTPQKLYFHKNGDHYTVELKGCEPEVTLSAKETLQQIQAYISARGFAYTDSLIENFYLSLKSKPFVILAGTSGTGKTRLVKLFAEAIGAEERYQLVSVRPDWSDGSDLFGHYNLNGDFQDGPVRKSFQLAYDNPDKPVFLCLDEMNLARVEYYLSDILSVIESREMDDDGRITTSLLPQCTYGIPDNLYIIGTVNMDETTFPFSKKVLDRANTIEFSYVDLRPSFTDSEIPEKLNLNNDFLRTEYLVLARDCADEKEYVEGICGRLQTLNEILKKANAHVGYRVRDEIVFYMLNNKKAEYLLTDDQAFDNQIMQKILPRIQGSSAAIKTLLTELYRFCSGSTSGIDMDNGKAGEQMQALAASAKYPASAEKIGYMMMRYEEDGFTSYWL